ncbi:nitric oxide reductase [Legionella israelensis]|nr:nitric oxide reductase [Legionella israelensis]STX60140.1 nitric oxide reductase [Legionella israelensis]
MTQNKKAVTEYAQETNDPVALVLKWILFVVVQT